MDFRQMKTDVKQFLDDCQQSLASNPHATDLVLRRLERYADRFHIDLQERFEEEGRTVPQGFEQRSAKVNLQSSSNQAANEFAIESSLIRLSDTLMQLLNHYYIGKDKKAPLSVNDRERLKNEAHNCIESVIAHLTMGNRIRGINFEINQVFDMLTANYYNYQRAFAQYSDRYFIYEQKKLEQIKEQSGNPKIVQQYHQYLLGYLDRYERLYLNKEGEQEFTHGRVEQSATIETGESIPLEPVATPLDEAPQQSVDKPSEARAYIVLNPKDRSRIKRDDTVISLIIEYKDGSKRKVLTAGRDEQKVSEIVKLIDALLN